MFLDRAFSDKWCAKFNAEDIECHSPEITADHAADFLAEQIPFFDCPDADLTEIYYFRWWSFRKHLFTTPFGHIFTEFMPNVPWAGPFNSIVCPAEHHIREARWLQNSSFAEEYASFWLNPKSEAQLRRYSFSPSSAIKALVDATGKTDFLLAHYDALSDNAHELISTHGRPCGMFFQIDGQDGMECSIGGNGFRTIINSLMYREFQILQSIAETLGKHEDARQWNEHKESIRSKIETFLWNSDMKFFMTRSEDNFSFNDVRELHGYTPWYFMDNLNRTYDVAWKQLMDTDGFAAPFGPTSAERRHPKFSLSHEGHECKWDGPSWPFATSVTLTALANLLHDHDSEHISKRDWFNVFSCYFHSHHIIIDGKRIPWIDENLDPFTGIWLAREIMIEFPKVGLPIHERGKDYAHSTFADLVVTGLCGLRPEEEDITVDPMLPQECWPFFLLDRIPFRGHELAIQFDRDGSRYHRGTGLAIYMDGSEIARNESLSLTKTAIKL